VASELTLEQVRKAGRAAHYDGRHGVADYKPDYITVRALRDVEYLFGKPVVSVELFTEGWHHDEDCDCEFCR
jgi:hypothetical protein